MANSMHAALAEWVGGLLGVPTEYGEFPGEGTCAMVKVSPGEPVATRYRSGGGIYQLPYEVYLRVRAVTEGQRIRGLDALQAVADAADDGECPDAEGVSWADHVVTNAPHLFAELPGTHTVYQMTARLTYLKTS